MITAVRHIGIVVGDMERSLFFWRDMMGFCVIADFWEEGSYIETVEALKNVKLHMIKLAAPDGMLIELLKDHGNPSSRAGNNMLCDIGIRHIAFTADDAEATWSRFGEMGFETLSRPVVSPDGKAKLFFARDPEGNLLELVQML